MDQDEKISVVIPAYKNEETIERAVMSALSQTYGNVEVVAVDDGSPDKTGEILDKLAGEHENLLVIHKENGGVSAARNDGIRKASGQWLVTLDGDDYMDDIMLERLHEAAVRGQSELVICGFRKVYPNGYREVFRPETELMFTILPHLFLMKRAAVWRIILNAPLRLTPRTLSQSCSFMNAMSPSRVIPALLTRTSMLPSKSFLI